MTVIVCIDTGRGMTFFGKRQSTDSVLRERVLSLSKGKSLFMNAYSASQFKGTDPITVSDEVPTAEKDSLWFTETVDPAPYADAVDTLVIYRWNRAYPREMILTLDPYDEGMRLCSVTDFEGSSHPRITEEIWTKRKDGEEIS